MKLSLADKLALIYTSAGSLTKTAGLAGISRQQVTRILHKAAQGLSTEYYERDPYISGAVDVGFDIHTDLVRGVATRHGLPFDKSVPVFAERLPLKHKGVFVGGEMVFKGSPEFVADFLAENGDELRASGKVQVKTLLGERVGALHVHWLSDKLRNAWITKSAKSGKYISGSVGSLVNLRLYNKQANEREKKKAAQGLPRTRKRLEAEEQIAKALREKVQRQRVFTHYQPMDPRFPGSMVAQSIDNLLQTRHAPATGEAGTAYADQVLFQLDTRKSKDGQTKKRDPKRDRTARKATPAKTGGNASRNRGSNRKR